MQTERGPGTRAQLRGVRMSRFDMCTFFGWGKCPAYRSRRGILTQFVHARPLPNVKPIVRIPRRSASCSGAQPSMSQVLIDPSLKWE